MTNRNNFVWRDFSGGKDARRRARHQYYYSLRGLGEYSFCCNLTTYFLLLIVCSYYHIILGNYRSRTFYSTSSYQELANTAEELFGISSLFPEYEMMV
jgi:hypothetical protein